MTPPSISECPPVTAARWHGAFPEPPGYASADDFRALMSDFPSGVAVVTALRPDGTPRGTTCSSLSSVTLSPPTLLVCLDGRSDTLAAVRDTGRFAVNLLHDGGRRAAETFAAKVPDRFERVGWRPAPGSGLPWLAEDALALAECRVSGLLETGDHTVVLGRVAAVVRAPGAPLLYGRRQFSRWVPAAATTATATATATDRSDR
ncbi:flavin reductase family protein [Kitasatospora sp. NPDC018619]|uniref:flavin reductase family protein n=1 Tax=unclassified Kitasatospora TaxID=2633591 RepID=UPI0037A69E56